MAAKITVFATVKGDTLVGGMGASRINIRRDSSSFSVSDLVIATPGASGFLHRGSFTLSPYPLHEIPFGEQFRLYYEVYGASQGEHLRISIKIKRERARGILERLGLRSGGSQATISFEQAAKWDSPGIAAHDVLLGGNLDPGRYEVGVTILSKGRAVTRHTVMVVTPPTYPAPR
jgi:hypothetical protein